MHTPVVVCVGMERPCLAGKRTVAGRDTRRLAREVMIAGEFEGIVLNGSHLDIRDGSRAVWVKLKDPTWYARESWRFDRIGDEISKRDRAN